MPLGAGQRINNVQVLSLSALGPTHQNALPSPTQPKNQGDWLYLPLFNMETAKVMKVQSAAITEDTS